MLLLKGGGGHLNYQHFSLKLKEETQDFCKIINVLFLLI